MYDSPATAQPLARAYGPVSTLLPTPPSSPVTIDMRPVENTISLLESLVAFYHQERMWVYRTRAQFEMGLLGPDSPITVDADLHDDHDSPVHSASSPDSVKTTEGTSPSPPTKWLRRKKAFNLRLEGISSARSMLPTVARGGISKHPYPHLQHRARQSSNLNPASVPASHGSSSAALLSLPSASLAPSSANVPVYPPTTMNTAASLTSPYLTHSSFQLSTTANQSPLTPGPRYVSTPAHHTWPTPTHAGPLVLGAGGREPTVQILEMFECMMQARMESCERMTRMVREVNKPGGIGVGSTSAVGGRINGTGSVGGPVGGFGGPAGLPVPQEIVGNYAHIQATARDGEPDMI